MQLPPFIQPLVDDVDGTIVECTTAYAGTATTASSPSTDSASASRLGMPETRYL